MEHNFQIVKHRHRALSIQFVGKCLEGEMERIILSTTSSCLQFNVERHNQKRKNNFRINICDNGVVPMPTHDSVSECCNTHLFFMNSMNKNKNKKPERRRRYNKFTYLSSR